jgi:curved DNA-binding protein CbpA
MLKDYYKILQIPPNATFPEIKRAYHKLAMIYHPDKNLNDPSATVQFSDIKEAYEVLTNPARKETYLQERWYNQSIGKTRTAEPITPFSVLRLSLEVEKYVSTLDSHRMNKEGLSNYISELLSSETIVQLKQFNQKDINRQIIATILNAMTPLPLNLATGVIEKLEDLADNDEETLQRIRSFLSKLKRSFLWNRYKIPIMILFTLLICLLIFFTSK